MSRLALSREMPQFQKKLHVLWMKIHFCWRPLQPFLLKGVGEQMPLVTLGTSVPAVKDLDPLPETHTLLLLSGGWTQQPLFLS